MEKGIGSRKRQRGRLNDGSPNPIDVHVGRRVRLFRSIAGLSQEALAERLGITFQQVQKYERGSNRISASRLYDMSSALDKPVSAFFDDMADVTKDNSPAKTSGGSVDVGELDPTLRRVTLELVRAFHAIKSPSQREAVYSLAKELSK